MKDTIKIMQNLPDEIEIFGIMLNSDSGELATFCDDNKSLESYSEIGEAVKNDSVFKAHVYSLFSCVLEHEDNENIVTELTRLTRAKFKKTFKD